MEKNLAVVIPTAGVGRRMKKSGARGLIGLPDGRNLLRRQIDLLSQVYPTAEIVVVVGADAEGLIKTIPDGVRVVENERHEQTGVVRSILMGLRVTCAQRCLVVYGDLIFTKALVELPMDRSAIVVDSEGSLSELGVGVTVENENVVHFSYGLRPKWTGVVMLVGRELALFKGIASRPEKHRLMGWEVLNEVLEQGGRFRAQASSASLVEVDCLRDLEKTHRVIP